MKLSDLKVSVDRGQNVYEDVNVTPSMFMNLVREAVPTGYAQQLPKAEAGQTSFEGIGTLLSQDSQFANVWHNQAVNLIARILFRNNVIKNPLAEYEGELLETGAEQEEMIIDTVETHMFNPAKAETLLFERRAPELYSRIHQTVRDVHSKVTVQDTYFTQIFRSVKDLDRYVSNVVEAILSGNEYEKYYTTKRLISKAVAEGSVRVVDLGSSATAKQLQTAILDHSELMLHPSRYYNMGRGADGVNIMGQADNLRMMMPVTVKNRLNVDFFVSAFNLDPVKSDLVIKKVDFFPDVWQYSADHTVTQADIDAGYVDPEEFSVGDVIPSGHEAVENATDATQILDASNILAFIHDVRALLINPVLKTTLSVVPNAYGRYNQIILNEKTYYSFSPYMPAVVITGTIADEDVISA